MTLCTFSKTWITVDVGARTVGACCRTEQIPVTGAIDINSDWHTSLRRNLAAGQQDPRCTACWQQEKNIGTSLRLNGPYGLTTHIANPAVADLQYLEIRLGNQCDGACVYCGGNFSVKQAKFWKLHSNIDQPRTQEPMTAEIQALIQQNTDSLREIVFLGGEPTLMESWYDFLEFVSRQQFAHSVKVVVTSNCNWTSKIKSRFFAAVEKFLAQGGRFDLRISGEGDRDYFNCIRKFSDYDTVIDNVKDLLAQFGNRISYTLQPVLNGISVYSMTAWLTVFHNMFHGSLVSKVGLNFAMLTRPAEFLTIHQGRQAVPSLEAAIEFLHSTDLFHPRDRMIAVLQSQISLLTMDKNTEAMARLEALLAAHDRILPHTWSSADALL